MQIHVAYAKISMSVSIFWWNSKKPRFLCNLCRYKSHPISFRFALVKLDEGICTFFISSTKCEEIKHDRPTIFCTLRGNARKIVKEQLKYIPSRTMQREIAKQINPKLAQEGHM